MISDIHPIILLAIHAGKQILDIYDSADFDIQIKEDPRGHKSPLTKADTTANHTIVAGLRKLFPGHAILSEEEKDDYSRLKNDYVWIIDPLDGTKEFIKRNGEFTVNIALVYKKKPVLGVIYVPVTGELFYAQEAKGAFCGKDGKYHRIRVSDRSVMEKMILVKSRSHATESLQRFISQVGFTDTITSGSSIKGCLVAKGEADAYPRLSPVSEWDICAMEAILTEAGGIMTDLKGKPLIYNKENIFVDGFLASNNKAHPELIAAIDSIN